MFKVIPKLVEIIKKDNPFPKRNKKSNKFDEKEKKSNNKSVMKKKKRDKYKKDIKDYY